MQTFDILASLTIDAIARYIITFIAPPGALAICEADETKKRWGQSMYERCAESGFVEPAISPEATRWNPMWIATAAARGGHMEIIAHHLRGERKVKVARVLSVAGRQGNVKLTHEIIELIRADLGEFKVPSAEYPDEYAAILRLAIGDAIYMVPEDITPHHVAAVGVLVAEYRSLYPALPELDMFGGEHGDLRRALSSLWTA